MIKGVKLFKGELTKYDNKLKAGIVKSEHTEKKYIFLDEDVEYSEKYLLDLRNPIRPTSDTFIECDFDVKDGIVDNLQITSVDYNTKKDKKVKDDHSTTTKLPYPVYIIMFMLIYGSIMILIYYAT
jgi:hypothetical protein